MHDFDEKAHRGQYREHCTILNIAPYIQRKAEGWQAGRQQRRACEATSAIRPKRFSVARQPCRRL